MKTKTIRVTYHIPGVTKPKTEHFVVEDIWNQEELNVHVIQFVREQLSVQIDWKVVNQEEFG